MSTVFKLIHSGEAPPEMVTVGVRVRDASPRDTLEVPVVYKHGELSENRTYTFIRNTQQRDGRAIVRERSTRFLTCPREVADLLASVEFSAPDPLQPGGIKRGRWLDVRVATTIEQYEKADSMGPSVELKAETAPEPPGLLRPKRVTRTDAAGNSAQTEESDDLEALTKAQLEEILGPVVEKVKGKATKAMLIEMVRVQRAGSDASTDSAQEG